MEVNCRIQVEHPVTEMVTGIDLVREQLRIAAGEPLPLGQEDVQPRGVAIECRINAEDPDRDFAPCAGPLDEFVPPGGPFVRVDTHAGPGDARAAGLRLAAGQGDRLGAGPGPRRWPGCGRALGEFRVNGDNLRTTRSFLLDVIDDPRFRAVSHSTSLVDEMLAEGGRTSTTASQGL